jgi:general stress protein 26
MPDNDVDRVWDLMESVRFCMLSTWNGQELRSRPMGAFVRRNDNAIWFFTDQRAHKDEEIRDYPQVNVAFADPGAQTYVAVSGSAHMSDDRAKIRELWSIPTRFWWDGPDDPDIRLIKVTPHSAEFWDSPGNLISSLKVTFGLLTGTHPKSGERGKVAM